MSFEIYDDLGGQVASYLRMGFVRPSASCCLDMIFECSRAGMKTAVVGNKYVMCVTHTMQYNKPVVHIPSSSVGGPCTTASYSLATLVMYI